VKTVEADRPVTYRAPTHSISDVAELTGVSAHTLRYYERIGLLTVARDPSGHRSYTAADIRRLVFITRLRHTDMPIRDIRRYFELVAAGPATERERLELLTRHRDAVQARLDTLKTALTAIDHKITVYGGSARPCP
jgi:DNA-binding transcriptional MerR regulator